MRLCQASHIDMVIWFVAFLLAFLLGCNVWPRHLWCLWGAMCPLIAYRTLRTLLEYSSWRGICLLHNQCCLQLVSLSSIVKVNTDTFYLQYSVWSSQIDSSTFLSFRLYPTQFCCLLMHLGNLVRILKQVSLKLSKKPREWRVL